MGVGLFSQVKRGNGLTLHQKRFRLDFRKNPFIRRAVTNWNMLPREGWSHHSWKCSQNVWMWCLRTCFSGVPGIVGLDFGSLFQLEWFCDHGLQRLHKLNSHFSFLVCSLVWFGCYFWFFGCFFGFFWLFWAQWSPESVKSRLSLYQTCPVFQCSCSVVSEPRGHSHPSPSWTRCQLRDNPWIHRWHSPRWEHSFDWWVAAPLALEIKQIN